MIRQSSSASRPNRLANRKASPFSKQSIAHAFRVMAPTLVALTFASAAHAQGTMDFSGAQTLMGTFKTFAIYAGAVICTISADYDLRRHSHDERSLPGCHPRPASVLFSALAFSAGVRAGLDLSPGSRCRSCHAHD